LLDGVYAKKFNKPSKIQGAALPIILGTTHHVNLIAQAQSGTGKTAAFVLGMLSKVEESVCVP
jgi:ATP-dependent RNA helicase DDX19/DBP5